MRWRRVSQTTLPPGAEDRVAQFAELVSTAISNIESRRKVERLAAEQSALRRVATLVAREHSPDDLFAALAEELGMLLEVDASAILRYGADSTATVVAGWSDGAIALPLGERFALEGENLAGVRAGHGNGPAQGGLRGRCGTDCRHRPGARYPFRRGQPDRGRGSRVGDDRGAVPQTRAASARTPRRDLQSSAAKPAWPWPMPRAAPIWRNHEHASCGPETRPAGASNATCTTALSSRLVSSALELCTAEATPPPELADLRVRLSGPGTGPNDVLDDLRDLLLGPILRRRRRMELTSATSRLALRRLGGPPVDLRLDLGTLTPLSRRRSCSASLLTLPRRH